MEVILVRHAPAVGNPEHRFLGITDAPLLPEGEALAEALAASMPPVEHVYTSPLRRARDTAALLWPGVEATVLYGLREVDFGVFENRTHAELMASEDPAYRSWLAQKSWEGYPGGDTFQEMEDRAAAAFAEAAADAAARRFARVGMVSHGGTIMALLRRCTDLKADFPENCGGFRLTIEPGAEPLRCIAAEELS